MALVDHQVDLVDDSTDPPGLRGGECEECGRRYFPFQTFGCEICGAHGDRLRPITLAARGVVLASTAVGHAMGRPLDPPLSVARILIEPGLEVRGRLERPEVVAAGTPVLGLLVEIDPDAAGEPRRELRFRAEETRPER